MLRKNCISIVHSIGIVFFLIFFSFALNAQESASKKSFFSSIFRSYAFQYPAFGVFVTPAVTYIKTDDITYNGALWGTQVVSKSEALTGVNLSGFEYGFRKNIIDFNVNSSLSVGFYPALSLSGSLSDNFIGVGTVKLPVYLELNMGNVSTWNTQMNKGFVVGLGIDYRITPLYLLHISTQNISTLNAETTYPMASFKIARRRMNKKGFARELALKLGVGLKSYAAGTVVNAEIPLNRPLSIDICYSKYINF
mgnify:CR=1 FL=1